MERPRGGDSEGATQRGRLRGSDSELAPYFLVGGYVAPSSATQREPRFAARKGVGEGGSLDRSEVEGVGNACVRAHARAFGVPVRCVRAFLFARGRVRVCR